MFIGDPTRLRQIILNLCSNAIKFTEKGNVHVAITCYPTKTDGVENICIHVKDTGIGIASDKLDTIFQKFFQADASINRKYGGTGLGLAITKTLVEIMGGTITVDSVLGEGSAFTVLIPLKVAEGSDIVEANGSLPEIIKNTIDVRVRPNILLVEDYMPNVMVATVFLQQFGYDCDVANNGLEAMEMVKSGDYALILMDVQMHGMNGLEATQHIRSYEKQAEKPRTPIIGMTAHAMSGDRERCLAVGMDDYIAKPFNPDELQEKIKLLLQSAELAN
jgi:CheY-like chemotaxis protein